MKKIYVFCIIVVVIIIAIIGYVFYNKNTISFNKIMDLSENVSKIDNVLLKIENISENQNSDGGTFYIKNGIEVINRNSTEGETIWTDINNNERIYISHLNKHIQVINGPQISNLKEPYERLKIYNNNEYTYTFEGKENFLDEECYVIQLKNDNNEGCKCWISVNNSLILKQEIDVIANNSNMSHTTLIYHYTFDVVNNSDIEKIDVNSFEGYTIEYF